MKKRMLVIGFFLGAATWYEVLYQIGKRTQRKPEINMEPLTDEQLEALVTWGQSELMGRWQNERLDEVGPEVTGDLDSVHVYGELAHPCTCDAYDQPLPAWEQQILDGLDPGAV